MNFILDIYTKTDFYFVGDLLDQTAEVSRQLQIYNETHISPVFRSELRQ